LTLENTFTVTRSSNTVSDVINGITLNLEKAGTVSLDVTRDTAAVTGSVQSFINAFNEVQTQMAEMRAGVLRSESGSLLSLEAQFRNVLNTAAEADSVFSYLFEIGVSTKLDGSLTLDTSILEGALTTDFDGVANLFADPTTGFAVRFETVADELLQSGGMFDSRAASLDDQIRALEDRKLDLEFRLESRESTLIAQFSALDQLVSQLQSTSNFLTLQLDQIAKLSPGNSSST
jgi:flagellar hook-associated protein 2